MKCCLAVGMETTDLLLLGQDEGCDNLVLKTMTVSDATLTIRRSHMLKYKFKSNY